MKAKKTVWQESVIPYILSKKTNVGQKTLLWLAEHTVAGVAMGLLSIGAIGVFAWENTKDINVYPSLTEVVFKKDSQNVKIDSSLPDSKVYTKGTFQPIVVENDENLQPLDQITSGTTAKVNSKSGVRN
jgi:hypothetical protein